MKIILMLWFLVLSGSAFAQKEYDTLLVQRRIRSICEYVTKNILHSPGKGAGSKPNLWPFYVDINYAPGHILFDSIEKIMPDLPKYVHPDSTVRRQIYFSDTTVAYIFDNNKYTGRKMTLFLSPPRGLFLWVK